MRSSGPRSLPRSVNEASRRLEAIEQEMQQILRKFPELRHELKTPRRAEDLPPRRRFVMATPPWQPRGTRVH